MEGHHACLRAVLGGLKLADPGITTEPLGLTETHSRPADTFTTAAVPGRRVCVCVASSNAPAAQETQRKPPFIERPHTAGEKSQTYELKATCSVRWFAQQMVGHTQQSPETCIAQQTSHLAATHSKCQQQPSRTGGNMKPKLPSSGVEQP